MAHVAPAGVPLWAFSAPLLLRGLRRRDSIAAAAATLAEFLAKAVWPIALIAPGACCGCRGRSCRLGRPVARSTIAHVGDISSAGTRVDAACQR